jgi:predicted metal-binding membrane protein
MDGLLAGRWAMWAMAVAMMLPSASPLLLSYGVIARRTAPDSAARQVYAITGGYVVAWTLFSLRNRAPACAQAAVVRSLDDAAAVAIGHGPPRLFKASDQRRREASGSYR